MLKPFSCAISWQVMMAMTRTLFTRSSVSIKCVNTCGGALPPERCCLTGAPPSTPSSAEASARLLEGSEGQGRAAQSSSEHCCVQTPSKARRNRVRKEPGPGAGGSPRLWVRESQIVTNQTSDRVISGRTGTSSGSMYLSLNALPGEPLLSPPCR
jgi:hypothetical protein